MAMRFPIPEQAPAVETAVAIAGAKLWVSDTGAGTRGGTRGGNGQTVVLCHPASQSSRIWLYQQPVLAEAGYRVVAYSRRGIYRSEQGPAADRGTSAGDLALVLDALGIKQAHVMGAAAGDIVALAFAVTEPARVASLTLAGTIFNVAEDDWRAMYARLGMAKAAIALPADFLELGPSYRAADPDGVARFSALEHEARPNGRFDQPSGATVTWARLEQLCVPVLLVTGEADLYAPLPLQQLVAAHLQRCETATLREVGHAPYWEAPAEFNRQLLDFLRRSKPAP